MSAAPKPKGRLPWRGSTFVVLAFLLVTILPAFIVFRVDAAGHGSGDLCAGMERLRVYGAARR